MYRVQVKTPGDLNWCGNGLTFDTVEQARDYAVDLFMRWTAVKYWRVIDANEQMLMMGPH